MNSEFPQSLDNVLRGLDKRDARRAPDMPGAPIAKPERQPQGETLESRHRKWFVQFAAEHVMPLFTHTVEALKKRGIDAHCQLDHDSDMLAAELVIVTPGLPQGARPPQLAIAAAPGAQGLSIDYTGTFPKAGAEGGFGGQIEYDTIYTDQLEEQLLEFVRLAIGA